MMDVTKLLLDSLMGSPNLGIVLTALGGLAVAGLAIYALLQAVLALGKRR
jgi:hypothetical protein